MSSSAISIAEQMQALASNPPQDAAERQALYNAARRLMHATRSDADFMNRVNYTPLELTLAGIACDTGVFRTLADRHQMTISELAEATKVDMQLLDDEIQFDPGTGLMSNTARLLRALAAYNLIREVSEGVFAASAATSILAQESLAASTQHKYDALSPFETTS